MTYTGAFLAFSSLLSFTAPALAHMSLADPIPYRSKLDTSLTSEHIDYTPTAPLHADGSNFPCKLYHNDVVSRQLPVYTAGQTYSFHLDGTAVHGGGSCQVSLSVDNGTTFRVINSYIGGCPLDKQTYDFDVPSSVPSAEKAIFAWSWTNKIGGSREFYMSCAPVKLVSSQSASSGSSAFNQLPGIWVADLKGINSCTTSVGEVPVYANPGPKVEYGNGFSASSRPQESNCELYGNGMSAGGGGAASPNATAGGSTPAAGGGSSAGTGSAPAQSVPGQSLSTTLASVATPAPGANQVPTAATGSASATPAADAGSMTMATVPNPVATNPGVNPAGTSPQANPDAAAGGTMATATVPTGATPSAAATAPANAQPGSAGAAPVSAAGTQESKSSPAASSSGTGATGGNSAGTPLAGANAGAGGAGAGAGTGTGAAGPGTSTGASTGAEAGGSCQGSKPGSFQCSADGTKFSVCNQGKWVSMGSVEAGMLCRDGSISNAKMATVVAGAPAATPTAPTAA